MILVSDTSVLIDLERCGFLETIFALPHEFAVPDVLYHRELKGEWGERLVGLGLLLALGAATYGGAILLTGAARVSEIKAMLRRRS